jgi:hypothetical protein
MILLLFYTFYRIYPTQYPTLQADNDRRDAPHHQQRPYKDTGRKRGTVRKLLQPMQHEPPADRHGHYIREISIRKVHGATRGQIIWLLNKPFCIYAVVAYVMAMPVGWWFMLHWLEQFAYRAPLSIGIFVCPVLEG